MRHRMLTLFIAVVAAAKVGSAPTASAAPDGTRPPMTTPPATGDTEPPTGAIVASHDPTKACGGWSQTSRRRSSRTSILRTASVAAAILTLGVGANVADTAAAQRPTGCVRRLVVSHVPGRLDKVWAIRCIPTHTTIYRY